MVIYDGLKASSKAAADDSALSPESKKRKRSKMTKRQKIEFAQVGVPFYTFIYLVPLS